MSIIIFLLAGVFGLLNMPLYAVTALTINFIIMSMSAYRLFQNNDERQMVNHTIENVNINKTFLNGTFIVVGLLLCGFAYWIISMVSWQPFYLEYIFIGVFSMMVALKTYLITRFIN